MKTKFKLSVILPLLLLVYLLLMAYLGRQRFCNGHYLYYFGIIGIGLVIIIALYFVLKKKEQLRRQREDAEYGSYADEDESRKK